MPRRRKAMAVDPAKSKTSDRKRASENIVQFKRKSSLRVRPSQQRRQSDDGDPGPAGFDWKELEP
jgi:hypothetical protein